MLASFEIWQETPTKSHPLHQLGVNLSITNHFFSRQCLFSSGRYRPGKDKPDPKTWKANFRCALNSLPDICELQEHSRKRGSNAYRVYRMMPSTQTHRRRRGKRSGRHVCRRGHGNTASDRPLSFSLSGLRLFSRSRERQESSGDDAYDASPWQPAAAGPAADTLVHKMEPPADGTYGNAITHGEMCVARGGLLRFVCCFCCQVKMIVVIVVVQECGRPNQRNRSRMRPCSRYQSVFLKFIGRLFKNVRENWKIGPSMSHLSRFES